MLRAIVFCKSGQGTGSEEKQPPNCGGQWSSRNPELSDRSWFSWTHDFHVLAPTPEDGSLTCHCHLYLKRTNPKPPQVILVTLWETFWVSEQSPLSGDQKVRSWLSTRACYVCLREIVIFFLCFYQRLFWDTKAVLFGLMGDHLITGPFNVRSTLPTLLFMFKF